MTETESLTRSAMMQKLEPRNDAWNRKYNFTDENSAGFFIEFKNGLAFFGWKFSADTTKYYQCEQTVFEKRFKITEEKVNHEMRPENKITFLRYPAEL